VAEWTDRRRHGVESGGRIRSSEMINAIAAWPGRPPISPSRSDSESTRKELLGPGCKSLFAGRLRSRVTCSGEMKRC